MILDISPVRGGKTTRMIEWVRASPHRMILTFSRYEADRLRKRYSDIKDQIIDWHSYHATDAIIRARKAPTEEVAVDNADLILQSLCREKISIITLTDSSTNEPLFPQE